MARLWEEPAAGAVGEVSKGTLRRAVFLLPAVCLVVLAAAGAGGCAAQARGATSKIFIDEDGAGPVSSDMLAILALLQAPGVDVLGIAITSGDVWMKEGVQTTLRMLELTGHAKVPVARGAEVPLINSREETATWEGRFGQLSYKGAWNADRYHEPDVVPALPAGMATIRPVETPGASLLIDTVRKYPGEVTVWAGGPLTTVALALRLDPDMAGLAKELVVMGGRFYASDAGLQPGNARREFNWWWDPEATRIVMSAPWKKITITPVDVSVKTTFGDDLNARIARSTSPAARYITKFSTPGHGGYMWDEIAALTFLDPSLVTRHQQLYVNVDISHGAGYGETIFVEKDHQTGTGGQPMPGWWRVATVQWDLDLPRFYTMFADLMSR